MKRIRHFILITLCVLAATLFIGGCSCSKDRLKTPTGITIDDDLNLSWTSVDGAKTYTVEITNVNTNDVQNQSTRKSSYSLEKLEEGEYEVRVKAIAGSKTNKDSRWSSVVEMKKNKENGCIYELINNKTEYKLKKYGTSSGEVLIEDTFRNKPVTAIGESAFRGSSRVETVIITGTNITEIGAESFYNCNKLTSVTIADSVQTIGEMAFQSCRQLASIKLPSGLKRIEKYTFAYCRAITEIAIPDSVTYIGESAFTDCSALQSVELPSSLVTLGKNAFASCTTTNEETGETTGLKSVTYGASLKTIGEGAFKSNILLTSFTYNGDNGADGALTKIGDSAFSACTTLQNITLYEGLEDIDDNAFYGCKALTSITIPSTVTHVGAYAFYASGIYTTGLDGIFIYADNWLVGVTDEGAPLLKRLMPSSSYEDVANGDYAPHANIVGIADMTFATTTIRKIENLTSVTLPNSVKYIGKYAFYYSSSLTMFTALSSSELISIGAYAFQYCEKLGSTSINRASKLTTIGSYAFYGCTSYGPSSNAVLPSSVTSIGTYAFNKTGFWSSTGTGKVVYIMDSENRYWAVGFNGDTSTTTITASITLQDNTVGVADFAFYNDVAMGLSTFRGTDLRYIGTAAFYGCTYLQNVTIGDNIKKIPNYAFYNCSALQVINMPDALQEIGSNAFFGCSSLVTIDLSKTEVKTIGNRAFYGATVATTIKLNEGLETIGSNAFGKATAVTSIEIPYSVKTIGDRAFYKTTSLSSITFAKDRSGQTSLESIGEYAFYQDTSLTSLEIPSSVKTIGKKAFYGAENLETLTLNEGLISIGEYAFFKTNALKAINLPKSLTTLGKFSFSYLKYAEPDADDDSTSTGTTGSETDSTEGTETKAEAPLSPIKYILLRKEVTEIGPHAMFGYQAATIYTDANQESDTNGWDTYWNSSYRPVIWGCTLDADRNYVVSVTITDKTISNVKAKNGITGPEREGYTFLGWSTNANATTAEYSASDISSVSVGTTLYAVWVANA